MNDSGQKLADRWDRETDVLVVGYGGTGAVAAITAAEAGSRVLLIEKAAEGGGNTAVASGGLKYAVETVQTAKYLKNISLGTIDDETAEAYTAAWVEVRPWLERHGAVFAGEQSSPVPYTNLDPPEKLPLLFFASRDGYRRGCGRDLFAFLSQIVGKLDIPVLYNTRAQRLVPGPGREVRGVVAESGGKPIKIRANKAVILTPGGFAANQEMFNTYMEETPVKVFPCGTPYNTGDGIKMVMDVGADLWHMNGIEWGDQGFKAPDLPAAFWLQPKGKSWLNINRAGKRFRDESVSYAHAKKHLEVFNFGVPNIGPEQKTGIAEWPNSPWYMVFDEKVRRTGPVVLTARDKESPPYVTYIEAHGLYRWSVDNGAEIGRGWIKSGAALEELAAKINVDAVGLKETIGYFNLCCASGRDTEFGRKPESLVPLDTPPYYALECSATIINTQGGPKRSALGQVAGAFGEPIPRLYAGGEFGSVWTMLYPGGGNLSEVFTSGLIAGRNAAAEKPWTA